FSAAVNAMRKPEVLYKQPLLWHISGAGSTFFAGSGRRLATRCVFCRMTVQAPYPAYVFA
ncbi:hypothetical protein, partial [Salmonella enterica]|uniref:hypothetical protein n=1 Tax=Salmonella enterica TaxID=28901 RepID=UPI001C38BF3B